MYFSYSITVDFYNKEKVLNIQYKIQLKPFLKTIVLTAEEYAFMDILFLYKFKKKFKIFHNIVQKYFILRDIIKYF